MKSEKMRKTLFLPFSLLLFSFTASAADLPTGYTGLESISSTGTQYVDTGYAHKANTKIVCEVSVASEQPSSWAGIFGARMISFQSHAFCFFAKCDNDVNKACYNRSGNEMRSATAFPQGVKTTLTCEGANATWMAADGTSGSILTTGTCDDGFNTMFVFNLNTAGYDRKKADTSPCVMTLYSFRIYEGDTLVREFVPCVRDSDGAIGLYDLAATESGKAFYANDGTGTFGLPDEVRCTVTIGDYPHMTAAYTYGDGVVTNVISGKSFEILKGRTDVKVIFTAMRNHKIVEGESVVELEGVVMGDVVFGEGNDYAVPTAVCSLDEIPYLDWDDVEKKTTNATLKVEYETVSGDTREFKDGHWYVITNTVEIADGHNLRVNGSARLILCDNASLTIKNVDDDKAAIDVAVGRALTIYGQTGRSGTLTATGGSCGAGIGGGRNASGGTVTIHGGTVTANGGLYSAGIGGGYARGAGGVVTITGGRVTARGYSYPGVDDIGHALGDDYGNDSGTVSISGGLFGMDVYISWLAENYWVTDNDDVETKGSYPHKVVYAPDKWPTVRFNMEPNVTGVKVRYHGRDEFVDFPADGVRLPIGMQLDIRVETANGYYYGGETTFVVAEGGIDRQIAATERPELPYRDWDPATSKLVEKTCSDYTVVDRYSTAFTNGGWYAVLGTVEISGHNVEVDGSAHLILCDNASLTVRDVGERDAAIAVAAGRALTIYGQEGGTGSLTVNGGVSGAGIGGGYGASKACGAVTVNGGTVTATGGGYGAGIGGGDYGAGGVVTVNGGTVTATGGRYGAGIGGANGGASGTVTLGANVDVVEGAVGNGSGYVKIEPITDVWKTEVELFGPNWYVTVPRKAYVNTHFKPGSNTRVKMDVKVQGTSEYWFGCWDGNWDDRAFALGNDGSTVYCGYGSGNTCGGIAGLIPSGRVTVALENGIVYTNGVVWSAAHASDATFSLNRNLFLFAQNRNGRPGIGSSQDTIVCYGCQIWTNGMNGAMLVLNFVPARTKDERQIVGLYDTVSGDFYVPHGGTLTLGHDENADLLVTIGDNLNMSAAWTSGDGSVTNGIDGTSFTVPYGTENVKVIFTADDGYEIVGETNAVSLGTVTENITFGEESGFMVPVVKITDPCLVAFDRGMWNMSVGWTRGDGAVMNLVAGAFGVVPDEDGAIKGTYVPRGSENVRIICAANPGYELVGESVIDLGTVTGDITFGQGNDFRLPIAYDSAVNVVYLDWDETNGRMTNAVARTDFKQWTAVTEATRVLKGCMVVTNDVTIPYLEVSPYSAVLVLCNDATLNVTGSVDQAGIEVASDRSLTITVRKGSSGRVVAQGGRNCAGIGSRFQQGAGSVLGAVRIVAGTVTATGGSNAAGIGNGFYGKGGSVKIFGGAVTATGGIGGASDIGDGSNPYSPCEVSVSGGVFAREPQDAWCADHFAVFANDDPASRADYPYAVLPASKLTIGKCPIHVSAAWTSDDGSVTNAIEGTSSDVPLGAEVRVVFAADDGWVLDGEAVVDLGMVTEDVVFGMGNDYRAPHAVPAGAVGYLDWDAANRGMTNATVAAGEWTLVTDRTRTLNDGWYVVAYEVVLPEGSNIVVNGSAHLILCDGASLSVTGGYDQAAVEVLSSGSVTNTLTIYGQTECRGRLTVQGGDRAAGIGSGFYGDFGAVTINGGTVTATGGWGCPAIGNGWWGQRGTVTINSGRVVAAGDMGRGNCAVSIRSGVFGMTIPDAWCAEHRGMFPNPDPATSAEFPYAVLPAWKVTIGDRQHMTVEWTSDDGRMTNIVEGTSFRVRLGERNVRVIFTADSDYALAGNAVVHVGTVNDDIVFGVGNDFKAPHAGVPYLDWDEANRVMTNAVSPVVWDEYSTSIRDLQDGHWYVVRGEHTIQGWSGLRVSGHVRIILCDESSLKVVIDKDSDGYLISEPGIEVGEGSSLTVYGQTNGSGRLTVNGGNGGAAGIGSRTGGPCGAVTINGGVVTATGGSDHGIGASGIGTGDGGYGGRVTINGGVVTATGNEYGAGIGDDYRGRNMTVIINGGTVTATGGADGASIKGDNVTINDGAINVGNMGGVIAVFGGVFRAQPQDGWLAAARSVVPNMDLTTADTHPWRVVESQTVVSLDAPLGPFATAEEATNAMATATFAPSEEIVSRILLRGVSPRRYSEKFGFGVTSKGEGAWYVEAALTDAAKAYLAETATKATRQIPVAEIAEYDDETIHGFWVQDCEPGFYYTLYCAADVRSLPDKGTKCGPEMCFEDGKLMFNWVDKPSDAAGFFTIGVSATKGK